jgi:hypothetical protein
VPECQRGSRQQRRRTRFLADYLGRERYVGAFTVGQVHTCSDKAFVRNLTCFETLRSVRKIYDQIRDMRRHVYAMCVYSK